MIKPIHFIAKRSELEKRMDPEIVLYNRKAHNIAFPAIELYKILDKPPQYGANEPGKERVDFSEPRYIRITDIDEYGNLKNNLGVTANTAEEKYFLNDNDILFARSGNTVGKTYIHKTKNVNYKSFFAGYMIRFVINKELALPDYIFFYTQTDIYKQWVKAVQRTAGQPNINAEEYKRLLIPLPDFDTQQKIVNLYQSAYTQKQQKEKRAQELLNSIDTYLLKELGITMPQKDNSLESRVFISKYSNIIGDRFDANSTKAKKIEKAVFDGAYSVVKLKQIVTSIKTGTTPHNSLKPYSSEGIVFIRNTNLKNGNLLFEDVKYIRKKLSDKLVYSEKHEVIICIAGTVGVAAVNNCDNDIAINQNVSSLKVNYSKVNPYFLNWYFNTELSIELVKSRCSIATIYYINNTNLLNLYIPLPPIEIQDKVVENITKIRNQAKQLQQEAQQVLNQAKIEVENIILGND